MSISFDLPDDIALSLADTPEGLFRAALEALAIEGYRSRQLSEEQVRRMLGFQSRWGVHDFLERHRVELNYSEVDLAEDFAKPIGKHLLTEIAEMAKDLGVTDLAERHDYYALRHKLLRMTDPKPGE